MVDLDFGGIGLGHAVVWGEPVAGDDLAAGGVDLGGGEGVALQDFVAGVAAVAVSVGRVAEPFSVVAVLMFVGDGDEGEDVERVERSWDGRCCGGWRRRHGWRSRRGRRRCGWWCGGWGGCRDWGRGRRGGAGGRCDDGGGGGRWCGAWRRCRGGRDRLIVGRFADGGADGSEGEHGGAAVGGPALPPWPPLEAPPEAGRRLTWWWEGWWEWGRPLQASWSDCCCYAPVGSAGGSANSSSWVCDGVAGRRARRRRGGCGVSGGSSATARWQCSSVRASWS